MSQSGQIAIAVVLSLSAMVSLVVAARAWRRKQIDAMLFSAVMLLVGIWLAGYAAEILLDSLSSKLVAARIQYIGIALVPPAWLLFALSHTSRYRWVNWRTAVALAIIPLITIALAWTSSFHDLLWSSTELDPEASASGVVVEYGDWFWVHTAYSYALLAGSYIALIVMFVRAMRFHRRQASVMLAGLTAPWLANVVYLLGGSVVSVDPTSLGLVFSGVVLAWGLWRWRLLDVKPMPRARSVEGMRDGVVVLDHQFRVVDFNPAAASLIGFDERGTIGQTLSNVVPALADFQNDARSREHFRFQVEGPASRQGGRVLEASISGFDEDPIAERRYWHIIARDVTEQDRAERRLREAEQRYRRLAEQIPAVTYIREWSDRLVPNYLSPRIQDLLGFEHEVICAGGPPTWEQLIFLEDLDSVLSLHRSAAERQDTFAAEYRLRSASGGGVWVRDEAVVIADDDGRPLHWQGVIVDVTDQKQLEMQLERHAFYDLLTGLPNRALLLDRLRQSLSRIEREAKLVGVLFIDLDGFKIINDTLGHAAGDHVLREVAQRITSCLRTGDTAGRLGGDEFVVVVESIDDPRVIVQIADRIISRIRQPVSIGEQEVVVSCSVGIRTSRAGEASPEDLLRDADIAMYWAKNRGRSQAVVFDPAMLAHRWNRLGLEAELRAAIKDEQLAIYYQPIVSLASSRITGFEALLRWIHPERGEILPDEFLHVAEESDLIIPIDRWMLETACRQMAGWQASLVDEHDPLLSISVNMTPDHIQQPSVISDIERALERSGLPAGQLTLEITESHTMQDALAFGERLDEIRRLGVKVIIDDFGTGYSALAYLRKFSIAGIKIDRSFVGGLGTRPDDTSLVDAVVSIARSFDLEVTAEGVETGSQWSDLLALGVEYGQGHFIARPLSAVAIGEAAASGNLTALIDLPDQPHLKIVGGE